MQTTLVLKDQLQIPDQIWQTYPLYLEITDESQDQFNIHHQSSMNIYDIKVAYAVKVVFQLLLDQNIQLLNELLLEAQKSKNQKYVDTIETIEFAVYQLNKEDPHFYLGTILNNKQISKCKLNSEQNITASSIYSFVLNTKLYNFFDEIKLCKKISNQCITNLHFNSNAQIVLYQTMKYVFVLIQRNEKQIEKHIQDQHQIFLKTIGLQLIQPSTRQNLAEKLKNQPYKMNSYQEFCKLLELDESQCSKEDLQKFFDEYVKGKSSITDIQNKLAEAIINIKQLKAQQSNRNFYYNYLLKNPRKHATNPQEQITQTTKIFINEDWFDVYVSPNQNIDQIISSLQQQGRIQQQIASVDLIDQNGYLEAKFYLMELLQFIPIQNFQLRIHCLNQLIDQTKRLTLTALNFNWKEQNESDKVYKIPFEPSLNMVQISEMINSNIYEQFTKIKFFKGEPLELIPELLTLEYFQIDENTMIFVEIICQIQQEQQQQQQQSQEQEQQEQQYQLQLQQQQEIQKQHDQHQEDQSESPTVLQDEVVNEQPPKDKEIHFSSLKIIPIQQTQIIKNTERFQRINPHIQQQQSEIAQNYQNNLFVFKEFSILIDCNSGSFLVYKFKNIEGVLRKENGKEIKHECKQFQPLSHQIEIAILKYGFLVKWEPNKFNSIMFKRNG